MTHVGAVVLDLGHTVWNYAPTEDARRYAALRFHARLERSLGSETPSPAILDHALMRTIARWIDRWSDGTDGMVQEPSDVLVRDALGSIGISVDGAELHELTQAELGTEMDMPVVEPDTLAALATLHERGLALGCVTNTLLLDEGIEGILVRLGLTRYITGRVVSSAMGYRKPHASLFLRALDGLGVAPEETVFVGDRLVDDVSGAKAVGMRAVLTHQYRQEPLAGATISPDAVIRRLAELPEVIERLDAEGRPSGARSRAL